MPTLQVLLREIWDEHSPPPEGQRAWCYPVYRSHVERFILKATAGARNGQIRQRTGRLEVLAAEQLRTYFRNDGWALTVHLVAVTRELTDDTWTHVAAGRSSVDKRRVSEWAATTVGSFYTRHLAVPTAEQLAQDQRRFLENEAGPAAQARKNSQLSDAELTERYTSRYDELWAEHGVNSLMTYSPTALGLGSLNRPPWDGDEGNWRSGTDRSVLSRYRRYFHPKGWVRNPAAVAALAGVPVDRHISTRLLDATPDEIAETELRRTCAPLGLHLPQHHALVASVADGAHDADLLEAHESRGDRPAGRSGPTNQRPTLRHWADSTLELSATPDPELAAAFAGYAEQWCRRNDTAERFIGGMARIGHIDWFVQVELGVLRRLWHFVHGREVEWELPFVRAELPRLLRGILQKNLLELVTRPITDPRDGEPQTATSLDPLREQHTVRVLAGLSPVDVNGLITAIQRGDERWRVRYTELVGNECFSSDEFRRWVAGNLGLGDEGEDDDDDEQGGQP